MAEIQAAGAICFMLSDNEPHYLILRSVYHGEWGPPKGHADENESEIETAMREIYEETGIRKAKFIHGFREILTYTVDKKGKKQQKQVVFFLSEMQSDDVELSEEHSEAHMATLAEIETMLSHDDLKSIFRRADKFIRKLLQPDAK